MSVFNDTLRGGQVEPDEDYGTFGVTRNVAYLKRAIKGAKDAFDAVVAMENPGEEALRREAAAALAKYRGLVIDSRAVAAAIERTTGAIVYGVGGATNAGDQAGDNEADGNRAYEFLQGGGVGVSYENRYDAEEDVNDARSRQPYTRARAVLTSRHRRAIRELTAKFPTVARVGDDFFRTVISRAVIAGGYEDLEEKLLRPFARIGLFALCERLLQRGQSGFHAYLDEHGEDKTIKEVIEELLQPTAANLWYFKYTLARVYLQTIASGNYMVGVLLSDAGDARVCMNTLQSSDVGVVKTRLLGVLKPNDALKENYAADAPQTIDDHLRATAMSGVTRANMEWLLANDVMPPFVPAGIRMPRFRAASASVLDTTGKVGGLVTGNAQLRRGDNAQVGQVTVVYNAQSGVFADPQKVIPVYTAALTQYINGDGGGVLIIDMSNDDNVRAFIRGFMKGSILSIPMRSGEVCRLFEDRTFVDLMGQTHPSLRNPDDTEMHFSAAACVAEKLNLSYPTHPLDAFVNPLGLRQAEAPTMFFHEPAYYPSSKGRGHPYRRDVGTGLQGPCLPYAGLTADMCGRGSNTRVRSPDEVHDYYA
jgi:hypothetical protein